MSRLGTILQILGGVTASFALSTSGPVRVLVLVGGAVLALLGCAADQRKGSTR